MGVTAPQYGANSGRLAVRPRAQREGRPLPAVPQAAPQAVVGSEQVASNSPTLSPRGNYMATTPTSSAGPGPAGPTTQRPDDEALPPPPPPKDPPYRPHPTSPTSVSEYALEFSPSSSTSFSPPISPGLTQTTATSATTPSDPDTPACAPSTSTSTTTSTFPPAIGKHHERVEGKTPISASLTLDPALHRRILPASIVTTADAALTGASAYADDYKSFSLTTGAPIGGMAKLARDYLIPADVRLEAENGGVSLRLAVVDQGHGRDACEGKKEKGRTKARVEVVTSRGGVEVDILAIDASRQLDLTIETGKGDVLVLLPPSFHGPLNVKTEDEPWFGPALSAQLAEVVNPYEGLWTTNVRPVGSVSKRIQKGGNEGKRGKNGTAEHAFMRKFAKYVPEMLREQDDYADMVAAGYEAFGRTSQSKVLVKTERGKVAFGYRETRDVEAARGEGLRVGATARQKHWWSL